MVVYTVRLSSNLNHKPVVAMHFTNISIAVVLRDIQGFAFVTFVAVVNINFRRQGSNSAL